jgi:hypothetical protein
MECQQIMQIMQADLINRHSKSAHLMCRYYCTQFLNFNIAAAVKLILTKTLQHLKVITLIKCDDWDGCSTPGVQDDYQIIGLF